MLGALLEHVQAVEQRSGDLQHPLYRRGSSKAPQLATDLVEPGRVNALDEVGEGRRAMTIALRCLVQSLADGPIVGSTHDRVWRTTVAWEQRE
jgi:hypothetical protein